MQRASCPRKGPVCRVIVMAQSVVSPRRLAETRVAAPLSLRRRRWVRRHRVITVLLFVLVLLTPVWWSLGSSLTDPGLGTSVPARFAEWLRGSRRRIPRDVGGEHLVQPPPTAGGGEAGERRDPAPGHDGRSARCRPDRCPPLLIWRCRRRSRPSPARPSPARGSGTRWAGPSVGCPVSMRRSCVPIPCTRAWWRVWPGWTPSSFPPRCTRGAPFRAGARGVTPRPSRPTRRGPSWPRSMPAS